MEQPEYLTEAIKRMDNLLGVSPDPDPIAEAIRRVEALGVVSFVPGGDFVRRDAVLDVLRGEVAR